MEKKIRVPAFLLLLLIAQGLPAQFSYLGLSTQKLSSPNPHLRVKQDSLYVPTQNGLFKRAIAANDTLWIPAGFQGMKINDFVFAGTDTIFCVVDSTQGNTVFISTDNGSTFFNSTNGFGGTGVDYLPGMRMDVNPLRHREITAMSGACVARSNDFGASWTPLYLNWGWITYQSSVLQYQPLDTSYLYSGGELSSFDSYLSFSLDAGATWNNSASEINNAVNGIAFHPANTDTVLLGKETKIARSADKGMSWSDVYSTPHGEYIYSIVYDANDPRTVYAAGGVNGTNDTLRVFRSTDGGSSWNVWVSFYVPNDGGGVISMIGYNNTLYFLSRDHPGNSHGVRRLDLPVLSVPEYNTNETLHLYPNPAAEFVNISGMENEKGPDVKIYSVSGRLVKEMQLPANAQLDVSALAAGLYFIAVKNQVLKFVKE